MIFVVSFPSSLGKGTEAVGSGGLGRQDYCPLKTSGLPVSGSGNTLHLCKNALPNFRFLRHELFCPINTYIYI